MNDMTDDKAPTQHRVSALREQLEAAGVYESASGYHLAWFLVLAVMYSAVYALLLSEPGWPLRLLTIVIGAIATMQFALFAHETAHGAVTRNTRYKRMLGQLSYSLLVGLSYSYWQSTHPVHHNHPQTEEVDPDMRSMGYSLYETAARRMTGAGRLVTAMQPYTVLMGLPLWGGGIKLDGIIYVLGNLKKRTAVDLLCICLHLTLWVVIPSLLIGPAAALFNYGLITLLMGLYMGAILIVPHVGTGTQTADERISFFERQVRYSRNYNSSLIGTLLCGGLNLQIEHHLLPAVPCVRLPRAQKVFIDYCREHDLPYVQMSYWQAWRTVFAHLRRMAAIASQSSEGEAHPMTMS